MKIHHVEMGAGIPVIFIHGFCEYSVLWKDFVLPLAQAYHILLPDLPGFGESPLSATTTLEETAQRMWDWVDSLGIQKPIVIGHSLGGYVSLAMAQLRPDGMQGLGLFHSTPLPDSEEKRKNRKKTYDFLEKNGTAPFLDSFVPALFYLKEEKMLKAYRSIAEKTPLETVMTYTLAMAARPSYQDVFQSLNIPVLVIAGEKDEIIPVSVLENECRLAKCAHMEIIPAVGHVGMWENPDACQGVVRRFLDKY